MSSGYGLNGGPSRCFPFWQDVLACYVVNTSRENVSGAKKCGPVLEDYYECLHHKKEYARAKAIQESFRRAEQLKTRENLPTAPQLRSLGLLGKEEESKALLESLQK